ncbi:MAG: CRISPR-associated helicase Cas3' [Bacteroidaceae bacterium]|nr:CRISPR-associated helicase Cas3' [Bacteroidaceae bacterium]
MPPHIAHICQTPSGIITQSLDDHANAVARLASQFASEFGMAGWGKVMGLLHDKGKERDSFQSYIRTLAGLEDTWHGEDKRHAFVGALQSTSVYKAAGILLAYPIMGHHAGLDDYPNFQSKLQTPIPEGVGATFPSEPLDKPVHINNPRDMHHLVRMLFSCLVDADYLDTEQFMDASHSRLRMQTASLPILSDRLNAYLNQLSQTAQRSGLNDLRQKIQNRCRQMADNAPGIYSLTVPTGGGKTLSSLVWALNHAIRHGKKRIIIAIPYTSIVAQTAEILSSIFGQENVLEHHSNFNPLSITDETLRMKMKLATENWDYPIIVTTNVQLFESIMSNRPSSCRKLHNLCNSVLILDEVQTLPLTHLQPIIDSLQAYRQIFGVSILFTTASLPALRGDMCWGRGADNSLRGIENIQEIIPKEWRLYDKLRRTRMLIDYTPIDEASLAMQLSAHDRALCIVNTRREAKDVFELLPEEGIRIHLSRMMCPAHLKKTLAKLKQALKNNTQHTIRVVATQLIEAGVDIDFPIVFRQEAGLDSVLQAAGRCNREGKRDVGDVHVFRLTKKPFGAIGKASDAMRALEHNAPDWYAPGTMHDYFIQRYSRNETFDKADMRTKLYKPLEWLFETAASDFNMIDYDGSVAVIVNYEDSGTLVETLRKQGPSYSMMKRLAQYTVNVRRNDFGELSERGLVQEVLEGIYYIPDKSQYIDDIGLATESHWLEETLTI